MRAPPEPGASWRAARLLALDSIEGRKRVRRERAATRDDTHTDTEVGRATRSPDGGLVHHSLFV